MTVADLSRACRRETQRYRRGEAARDGYGVELFRRAVCEREAAAWGAVVAQFGGLLLGWLKRHPASDLLRGEEDDVVNRALTRFWLAIGPERFHRFTTLAAILAYLKMCVHCALLDEARSKRDLSAPWPSPADGAERERAAVGAAAPPSAGRVTEQELWQTIARELPDQAERLVVYLSFALDLKPGEIHRRHRDRYPTAEDVYRVKRAALDRLRRSPAMRSLLAA
jgi:hypothetical protein